MESAWRALVLVKVGAFLQALSKLRRRLLRLARSPWLRLMQEGSEKRELSRYNLHINTTAQPRKVGFEVTTMSQ